MIPGMPGEMLLSARDKGYRDSCFFQTMVPATSLKAGFPFATKWGLFGVCRGEVTAGITPLWKTSSAT